MKLPKKENMQFGKDHGSAPQHYYSSILGWPYRRKLKMLFDFLPAHSNGNVLEVGFGSGISLRELSDRFSQVYALDIHNLFESVQRMLIQERISNAHLINHNLFEKPLTCDVQFDFAVSSSVFEHIPEPVLDRGIANVARALKTDGIFLIGFPLKTFMMDNLFRLYQLTYQKINKMYNFDLEHDHPSGQNEIIPALQRYFNIEERQYFVNCLVPLYTVLKCAKKRTNEA